MPLSGTQTTRLGHYGGPRAARAAFAPKAEAVTAFTIAPLVALSHRNPVASASERNPVVSQSVRNPTVSREDL